MFDMFDDFMIEDDYALEAYLIEDDYEYLESTEQDSIVIESMMDSIAMEAEKPDKKPGKIRMGLGKVCQKCAIKCSKNAAKAAEKKHPKLANLWKQLAGWFDKMFKKLTKLQYGMHTDEIDAMYRVIDEKQNQVKLLEQKQEKDVLGIEDKNPNGQARIAGRGVSGRIGMQEDTVRGVGGTSKKRMGNPVSTPPVINVGGPSGSNNSRSYHDTNRNMKLWGLSSKKNDDTSSNSGDKQVAPPSVMKEIDDLGKGIAKAKNDNKPSLVKKFIARLNYLKSNYKMDPEWEPNGESFTGYDFNLEYALESVFGSELYELSKDYKSEFIVQEGLFSKQKSKDELISKIQKKANKLKTIGQCDDMLRQLDAEAAKFNNAISSLKKSSAEFQQTNDKTALKRSAGPVLKELNKTCKLLNIKNISSDPKNITGEEIQKLRDVITGAKQAVKARKQQISGGGATESMIDTDDFLDMVQYDEYNEYDIADEMLIEDFDEADQAIAIATEGIIDPDAKRAHRIKFGEKKRQIKSVVKKARAAKKEKDYTSAIALYQEAKKGYAGLLTEAKKIPDRYDGYSRNKFSTQSKTGLINWCIRKMGECDDAIEAIRNGQMKSARKAAAKESYLDDVYEYESVIENMYGYDDDDYEEYDSISGLESLLM